MVTYILFIYANFEDHEDVEFFCAEHFSQISERGVKYVIEKDGNCIIIFESDKDKDKLDSDLEDLLDIEQINFYFLFERASVVSVFLPETIKDFIFKPLENENVKLKITANRNPKHDLDEILEKIENGGIESLTLEEKKFLDDFGK